MSPPSGTATSSSPLLVDVNVFPESKIKAQLRRYPKFGRVVDGTLQSVRVGSALLIQGIVDGIVRNNKSNHLSEVGNKNTEDGNDSSGESMPNVIRLVDIQEFIRQHSQEYHFVSGRIHKLSESESGKKASKRPRHQQQVAAPGAESERKNGRKKLSVPLEEAMALAEQQNGATICEQDLIVADDDDYD